MTDTQTYADALNKHMEEGLHRYGTFPTLDAALHCITDRTGRLAIAITDHNATPNPEFVARRLLQLAGLCLKTAVSFGLPAPLPTNESNNTTQDDDKTPSTT